MASFSASTDPVSLIAIVPVTECRIPTVTSVSVTASPVVFTCAVGGTSAQRQLRAIIDDGRERRRADEQLTARGREKIVQ